MGEPNRAQETQGVDDPQANKLAQRVRKDNERLVWAGIVVVGVIGIVLVLFGVIGTKQFEFGSLLQNVGYGLLGATLTATAFRLTAGLGDKWQQERTEEALGNLERAIAGIPAKVEEATGQLQQTLAGQEKHVSELSKLLATANSLGVIALAENRDVPAFSGMTWVQRWDYMLQNCEHVDLLCYEDGRIFTRDRWLKPGLPEHLIHRLSSDHLTLRILLSVVENPVLKPINDWLKEETDESDETYMQDHIKEADKWLRLSGISTRFPVLRRHNELLPFTLMRGDDEMYIMYFFPKGHAGPIIQVAPPPLHASAHPDDAQRYLFKKCQDYFDALWTKYGPKKQADTSEASPAQ